MDDSAKESVICEAIKQQRVVLIVLDGVELHFKPHILYRSPGPHRVRVVGFARERAGGPIDRPITKITSVELTNSSFRPDVTFDSSEGGYENIICRVEDG